MSHIDPPSCFMRRSISFTTLLEQGNQLLFSNTLCTYRNNTVSTATLRSFCFTSHQTSVIISVHPFKCNTRQIQDLSTVGIHCSVLNRARCAHRRAAAIIMSVDFVAYIHGPSSQLGPFLPAPNVRRPCPARLHVHAYDLCVSATPVSGTPPPFAVL